MNHFLIGFAARQAIASKVSCGIVLLLTAALTGCGGGGTDDFSKPLAMPKAPPAPASDADAATAPEAVATAPAKESAAADTAVAAADTAVAAANDEPVTPTAGAPSDDATPMPPAKKTLTLPIAKPDPIGAATEAKPVTMPVTKPVTNTSPMPTVTATKAPSAKAPSAKVSATQAPATKPALEPLTADEREWLSVRHRQATSFDGQFAVTAVSMRQLHVHDIRLRSLAQKHDGKASPITALAIGLQRKWIVAANESGSLRLWSATQATSGVDRFAREALRMAEAAQPTIHSEQGVVRVIAVHPDGQSLVTGGDDGSLQIWNVLSVSGTATLQKGRRWQAHEGIVTALAMSADGLWIASGGHDRKVHLWDSANGAAEYSWADADAAISDVALSANGKVVVASSFSKAVNWWTLESPAVPEKSKVEKADSKPAPKPPKKTPLPTRLDHPDIVLAIAVSSDGTQVLTACKDKLVRIWDPATKKTTGQPEATKDAVVEVRFVDGDKRLLTRDRSGVIRNRPRVVVASNDDGDAQQAVASANSEWLFTTPPELFAAPVAVSNESPTNPQLDELLVKLRSSETQSERDDARATYFASIEAESSDDTNKEPPKPVRWRPPVNSSDRSERPQLIGSLTTKFQFAVEGADVGKTPVQNVQLALTSQGEFLTAFETPNLDSDTDGEQRGRTTKTTRSAHQVWWWDVPSQGLLRHWDDLSDAPTSMQFVETGSQLVSSSTAQRLSLVSGITTNLRELNPAEKLLRLAVSPDGKRFAAISAGAQQATTKVVRLLDSATCEELAAFEAFEAIGTAVEFLPDGSSLVVAIRERQRHRLLLLDASTLVVQATLEEQTHPQPWLPVADRESSADLGVTRIVISPEGRALMTTGSYGGSDFRLTLWGLRSAKWIRETHGNVKSAQPVVDERKQPLPLWFVSGKTNYPAAITAKGLGVIDSSNGRLLRSVDLKDGPRERGPCAWSGDGNWFAQGDNAGNVALWNLRSDKEPGYFVAQLGPLKALTLSSDGQTLATLGEENQLHLWNLANWNPKNRVVAKTK